MPEFSYTNPLDPDQIIQANVDAIFTEIQTKINTTKHSIEQFKRNSIRYRHMREPFRFYAESEKTGTNLFTGALDKGLNQNWDWTEAQIKHQATIENAINGVETGHPIIHVHGTLYAHDWETSAYEIGLGYSTNDGVSFTFWPNSNSFLGVTRADDVPMWSASSTTHYHTGVTTSYFPPSMYAKRAVHTTIAVMTFGGVDVRTITDWALGIRVNSAESSKTGTGDVHSLDTGKIWLIARDIFI